MCWVCRISAQGAGIYHQQPRSSPGFPPAGAGGLSPGPHSSPGWFTGSPGWFTGA